MNKKIISFILAFCLLTTSFSVFAAGDNLSVVSQNIKGHWAENEIMSLYERNVITTNTPFLPDNKVTRSDWFIWLGENIILPFVSSENRFQDVTSSDECFPYVESFYQNGVIPDEMIVSGSVGKDDVLTRQEMIYTAVAALKLRYSEPMEACDLFFSDQDQIDSWAVDAVKKAAFHGIIVNHAEYNFRPQDAASNAECAVVLSRLYEVFQADYEYKRFVRIQKTANGAQGTGGRSYVYSALCKLYLGRDIQKANDLLNYEKILNATTYEGFEESPFIMYWCVPAYIRIYIWYNSENGTVRRDMLTPETEANMRKVMWSFVESYYPNVFSEDNNPFRGIDSENHDALKKSALYLIAQILSKTEQYQDKVLPDGKTLPEFIAHAEDFYEKFVLSRAKTGLFVEGSENYRAVTYESLYNIIEFSDNEEIRNKVKMLVDVSWIEYAVESLDGIRGSAKTRVYNTPGDADTGFMWFSMLGSMYFGLNAEENATPMVTELTSDYRPPEIAKEIATQESKGYYKYIKAIQGFGKLNIISFGSHTGPEYIFDQNRDVITYEYVTPDYIASTMYQDDADDLTILSSQNRWEGAVFKGDVNARIYRYLDTTRSLHSHFSSMQNGPIMMFKKSYPESFATGIYIYPFEYMENDGELPTENGWLFGQIGDAYYAIKPMEGTLEQKNNKILLTNSESPFIIHLGSKKENCCFGQFKEMIKNNLLAYNGNTIYYRDPVWGEMEFNPMLAPEKARIINDSTVPYNLEYIMKSPYLNSVKNSGVIEVTFNDKHIIYDFNTDTVTEEFIHE